MKTTLLVILCPLLLQAQETTGELFIPFHQEEEQSAPSSQSDEEEDGIDFFSMIPVAPKELEITNDGTAEYELDKEELIYKKNVVIKGDSGIQIYADEAQINTEEQRVTALGNVSVYNGPYLFRGERAVYYYEEKRLDTRNLRTGYDPFLLEARSLKNVERDGKQVLVAEGAAVTTDDYKDPSFWIKADQFSLFPDDMAVMRGMTVEVGGVTVFWLPYLAQSLDRDLGYHFTPGGQSNLGFFWKSRYGMHLGGEKDQETGRVNDPEYLLSLHVDPYTRRGVGLGFSLEDLEYAEDKELGFYSAYWIYDLDPEIERTRTARTGLVDENRFRLEVKDRRELGEVFNGDLRLDSNLTYLSDQFFLEDYDEGVYKVMPQPDNIFSLTLSTDHFLSNLTTRFQLNSFYEVDTRLPELAFDYIRSPLLGSSVLYESQTSFGFFRKSLADQEKKDLQNEALTATPTHYDEIQDILEERGFFRAHSWQEFSRPFTNGYGLSLTPRAGVGYTFYNNEGSAVSDGRLMSHIGLDLSLKLAKSYPQLMNESLGLEGLNHVIQPYLSLSVLEVSHLDDGVTGVDTLTPVTRPRPIHVGRYSAIDELDDWALIRAGIRQTFLTKRDGNAHHWLYWDSYMDVLLGDSDSTNSFSNLYNELRWNPLPWVNLYLETQFPIANSANDFSELYMGAEFMIGKSTSVDFSYGWLKNHPIVQDSNSCNYSVYHRLDESWGLGLEHRWQFDDSTLELQRYSLHRNLKSWIFSTEIYRRDYRVDQEWGFTVGFTLRDFPEISLPVSLER